VGPAAGRLNDGVRRAALWIELAIAPGAFLPLVACHKSLSQQPATQAGSVLRTGMAFSEAERILSSQGAQRTSLGVAPPPSSDPMEVDCFSLSRDRALCITHAAREGSAISDMELMEDMDKPKNQRTTRKVTEIAVRRP
jgi:hypothetical protein